MIPCRVSINNKITNTHDPDPRLTVDHASTDPYDLPGGWPRPRFPSIKQLYLNDQLSIVLWISLHIPVAIGIHNHPGLAEHIVKRVVCMAVNPEIGPMIDDLVGNVGHEGAIEAVPPELFMNRER
jgi:hypothetical protein